MDFKNKLEGFDISSKYFVPSHESKVYISHEYKGVFELKISKDDKTINSIKLNNQLKKGTYASLVNFENELIYFNDKGLFFYKSGEKKFENQTAFNSILKK